MINLQIKEGQDMPVSVDEIMGNVVSKEGAWWKGIYRRYGGGSDGVSDSERGASFYRQARLKTYICT